jgi:hypothetical protein
MKSMAMQTGPCGPAACITPLEKNYDFPGFFCDGKALPDKELPVVGTGRLRRGPHNPWILINERVIMILPEISRKHVEQAATDARIKSPEQAADIIRMMVELRNNGEIIDYMKEKYGPKWNGSTLKRKFIILLQGFITYNYLEEFNDFCRINDIDIFNEDLDISKADATYSRFVFITFLRENLLVRKTMELKVS